MLLIPYCHHNCTVPYFRAAKDITRTVVETGQPIGKRAIISQSEERILRQVGVVPNLPRGGEGAVQCGVDAEQTRRAGRRTKWSEVDDRGRREDDAVRIVSYVYLFILCFQITLWMGFINRYFYSTL